MFAQSQSDHLPFDGFARFFETGCSWCDGWVSQLEILGRDALSFRHYDRSLNPVFQFAHVARPGVPGHGLDRVGVERKPFFAMFGGEPLKKFLSHKSNIAFTLS